MNSSLSELKEAEMNILIKLKERLVEEYGKEFHESEHKLLRFLKAREFDVDKAQIMLRNHFEWKRKHRIDFICEEYTPPEVYQKFPIFNRFSCDDHGYVNVFTHIGNLDLKGMILSCRRSEFILSTIQFLEQSIKLMDQKSQEENKVIEKWNYFVDFNNFSLANATYKPGIDVILQYLNYYEANYPERLNVAFIINTSPYFWLFFNIIKPFLTGRTLEKIKIFGKDGWKDEISKFCSPDELPAFLGGNLTDPDGNPRCLTMVCHGGTIPKSYYLTKEEKTLVEKDGFKQYSVQRMSKVKINVQVDEPGSSIEWEFQTENHDIGFGLTFIKEGIEFSKPQQVIPVQRVDSQYLSETGVFKCVESGMYSLIFDNKFSWFRHKEVFCRIHVVSPEGKRICITQ